MDQLKGRDTIGMHMVPGNEKSSVSEGPRVERVTGLDHELSVGSHSVQKAETKTTNFINVPF